MGAHPVARLARFPVANVVDHDDVVAVLIKQLAGTEQHVGKLRSQKLASSAGLPNVK